MHSEAWKYAADGKDQALIFEEYSSREFLVLYEDNTTPDSYHCRKRSIAGIKKRSVPIGVDWRQHGIINGECMDLLCPGFHHVDSSSSSLRFPVQYLERLEIENILIYSENVSALVRHQVVFETLALPKYSTFMIPPTTNDSALSMDSVSDQDTDIISPSKLQREPVYPNVSSTPDETILEATPCFSSDVRPDLSPKPASDDDNFYVRNYRDDWGITLPRITISAFTETGQAEESIQVPKQRRYTGRRPVIPSSLADAPCASLGVQGVLDRLNVTLGTSHTLDTPSVLPLLKECIEKDFDFGTVYGHLREVWNTHRGRNMQDELRRREEEDRELRRRALAGNMIVNPNLDPRRVWDLYSNRVVPYWAVEKLTRPISHAWVDEKDRVNVLTPINGKEWPVPIPKDANLNLIRIEMLNFGQEYMWLDVICLRQKGGLREDLRVEEWKLDVPTIGWIYQRYLVVVIYLSGFGRPFSLKEGDLDSNQCWFRRAWTVQEVGFEERIIAGDTLDGPMHEKPIDSNGHYETAVLTRFHKQLETLHRQQDIFSVLTAMQNRVSTNPVDKVAGLAIPMDPTVLPTYYESRSLEDAWTALINTTHGWDRGLFLFQYPGVGLGCKKWRPTWDQVMSEPLPAFIKYFGSVEYDDESDEDWVDVFCIEKGILRGLDVASTDKGIDRWGELVVKDAAGTTHALKIRVAHQFPIPEDVYTLIYGQRFTFSAHTRRDPKNWAVGRRMPEQKFQKVSVFVMDWEELKRLHGLRGVVVKSRNILV
ncbi:hypothetical protein EDD18DRAFT_1339112 [Armillaria luteobubalina]|uniref:Heterokaryon incompatibility domain-containing protein n=1 Tax=Armillaria luteobubalina TaxID=153913 RepID=A0AA39NZU1_9AGAR|nr:hypothetical protein EDD18DRAFT_1339112 [Armillaria luteobubalina]